MNYKKIAVTLSIIVLICIGVITYLAKELNYYKPSLALQFPNPKDYVPTSSTTPIITPEITPEQWRGKLDALLAEKWVLFTNARLHYAFMHPISLEDYKSGKGGEDALADLGSMTTFLIENKGIFNIGRIYLDEQSIQSGFQTNIKWMRSEGYGEQYIKEYSERISREFADTRKYRDIPFDNFARLIQKALTPANGQSQPLQKITVAGLPAYEFIYPKDIKLSEEGIALKLPSGYAHTFETHHLVFFESLKGEKYYIHYNPENPVSKRIFESFHFVK